MMDAGRHPNIKLMAFSEVENVSGYVGNFKVTVRKKARYVDTTLCNSCGECAKVCPVTHPDEFQMGLSTRRAVYLPLPQAVPSAYLSDMEWCLGTKRIACGECVSACTYGAVELVETRTGKKASVNPVLCKGDQTLVTFRKWVRQFYLTSQDKKEIA